MGIELTNRRGFLVGGASALAFPSVFAADAAEADAAALAATKAWFREAQFGMMAHFGLYTLAGGEWRGRNGINPYGEWIMHGERIPNAEYAALAKAFNPVLFDPLDWMKRARDAGMKYFVVTSKHHDGFAMYRSRVSKYNVVDATPFGRDPMEEIAEACRATGIRFGIYYSQDLDWHERNGGGRFKSYPHYGPRNPRLYGNDWDWPSMTRETYDFQRYLDEKSMPQVDEILTQYGDLCLVWFDVPATMTRGQSEAFVRLVRRRQPGCLVSGRIGNGLGDYMTPIDNVMPRDTKKGRLYEMVGTMNDSWGYRPTDTHYKSVGEILGLKAKCASIGSNYLLNVGPDPLGRFPVAAIDILDGLGKAVARG